MSEQVSYNYFVVDDTNVLNNYFVDEVSVIIQLNNVVSDPIDFNCALYIN